MLYVNGHGSNQSFVETAARLVSVEYSNVLAAAVFYLTGPKSQQVIADVRESELSGIAHACELETSIYLAIDPGAVEMDRVSTSSPTRPASTPGWTGATGRWH